MRDSILNCVIPSPTIETFTKSSPSILNPSRMSTIGQTIGVSPRNHAFVASHLSSDIAIEPVVITSGNILKNDFTRPGASSERFAKAFPTDCESASCTETIPFCAFFAISLYALGDTVCLILSHTSQSPFPSALYSIEVAIELLILCKADSAIST